MGVQPAASSVDRGWAWVVCVAGSFLHILVIGNVRSTGLLLANVSEHYNRNKRDTSWILSLMFLVFLMLTPVTMALARRYSVRLIVFIGSCFLSFGFALSYFAESLELLYLTIGLLVGIGLAMTHPPTVLILSYYFHRRSTTAMGITFAGCSVGALCMPPLMNLLIEYYTFRGCMLVWGGLMLNVAVAAALMRPFVAASSSQGVAAEAEALIGLGVENEAKNAEKTVEKDNENADKMEKNAGENADKMEKNAEENADKMEKNAEENADKMEKNAEENADKMEKNAEEKVEKITDSGTKQKSDTSANKFVSNSAKSHNNGDSSRYCTSVDNFLTSSSSADAAAKHDCRRRVTSMNAPAGRTAAEAAGAPAPHASVILLASCGEISIAFDAGGGAEDALPQEVAQRGNFFIRLRRNFSESGRLMRQPRFWLLLFSLSLAVQGMPFNFMVLPQHGKHIGMTATEYTRLLQYQGLTDLVTRVGIGFLADRMLFRRQLLMIVLAIAQGALWCLLLHPTPGAALAFSLLEGLLAGGLVPNLAPILVETFGVENLPLSYGMLGLMESGVMMSVPVLLGELFDETGSWRASIIFVSVMVGLSGLLLLIDDLLHQRSVRRQLKRLKSIPC